MNVCHQTVSLILTVKPAVMFYLQTGEELGELGEERQEDKSDEVGLRGRFGHFVSVHERSHWEPFEFLCVALHKRNKADGFKEFLF